MISKSYISSTLNDLERLYNSANSQKKTIYYSKLAVIELCGWIEETVDDILLMHVNRKCRESDNKNYFKNNVIKPNSSFQYYKLEKC